MLNEKGFCLTYCYKTFFAVGVLGDGLGYHTDSVLGQLTRKEETGRSLDLRDVMVMCLLWCAKEVIEFMRRYHFLLLHSYGVCLALTRPSP